MENLKSWATAHQVGLTMLVALFAFALLAMCPVKAGAAEIESHSLSFDAKCIRGGDAAEIWITALIDDWDEVPIWIGNNDGGRIIITRNSHNPTWSFLIETPDGTCLMSSGNSHHLIDTDGSGPKVPSKSGGSVEDDRV